MSKSLRNYPDPLRDVRHVRLRRRCGGSCCRRPSCAAPTSIVTEQGIRDAAARCCCRCGTRGTSSRSTPTPRTTPRAAAHRPDRRARPLPAGQAARPRGHGHRADGRLRPVRRLRRRCGRSSTCSRTGTSAAAATGSGPATPTPSTRSYTALHVLTRVAAPLLPLVTEEIYRGLTGERSVHLTDWPDAADAAGRPRPRGGHGHACATCARRRCRSARPAACGCGCRWRRSRWPRPTPTAWRRSPTSSQDEVNVKEVQLTDDVGARPARSSCRSCRPCSAPASAPTRSGSSGP